MSAPVIVSSQQAINAAGITLTFTKPSGLQAGDVLLAALRSQSPASTLDWTCSGFSRVGPAFLSASASQRVTGFYRYVVTDPATVPASIVFTINGSAQRNAGALMLIRGSGEPVDVDSFFNSTLGNAITNGREIVSYNTTHADTLILVMGGNEIVSPNATLPTTTPIGHSLVQSVTTSESTAVSRTVCYVTSKVQAAAGATSVADLAWASASSAVAMSIALYAPVIIPVAEDSTGADLTVSVFNGTTETDVSIVQALPYESYSITEMEADIAAGKKVYSAHRGGSADWPQMTMRAYTNAVWHGAKILEVSCRSSSDGVFVMIHDNTTDAVTATSYTVSSTNSSTLLGIAVDTPTTGGVLGRLEDILEAYPNFVIIADHKAQGSAQGFLDKLKQVPDWQNHVILKFDGQYDKATGSLAHDQGFKTMPYLYEANYAAHLDSILPYTDYLGLNYDASAPVWATFVATGKTLWGHVCATTANANAAIAGGAKIIQCSGVKAIIPKINTV